MVRCERGVVFPFQVVARAAVICWSMPVNCSRSGAVTLSLLVRVGGGVNSSTARSAPKYEHVAVHHLDGNHANDDPENFAEHTLRFFFTFEMDLVLTQVTEQHILPDLGGIVEDCSCWLT